MGSLKGIYYVEYPLDVLQKRVFPTVEARDPDILLGAAFGEDVALSPGLSEEGLMEGRRASAQVSVMPEALILPATELTAMHGVTRGGIPETVLEIADLS